MTNSIPPHVVRMIEELAKLSRKINKLWARLESPDCLPSEKDTDDDCSLVSQYRCMCRYATILSKRLEKEFECLEY